MVTLCMTSLLLTFLQKTGNVQYNAVLAITGAIKETSREMLYKELGLESLKRRRLLRLLCTFYKIKTTGLFSYLFRLIPNKYTPVRIEQWIMLLKINVEQKHLNHISFPGPLPNGIV